MTDVAEARLDRGWIRFGGAAGIVAAAIELAAGMSGGTPPTGNPTPAELSAYLASHQNAILTQTVLTVAGLAFVLWFFATIAHLIHERDPRSPLGTIVLAGGVAGTGIIALDGLTVSALVLTSKQGVPADPALTRALWDLQSGLLMPGAFGLVMTVFFVGIGTAILRGAFAAPWLARTSLAFAGLSTVSGIVGLTAIDGGTTPLSFFPAVGLGVVAIASGIYLLRDEHRTTATTLTPATAS